MRVVEATVGDLRKALEGLPDDAPIEATHDGGYGAAVTGLRRKQLENRKFDLKGARLPDVLGLIIDVE